MSGRDWLITNLNGKGNKIKHKQQNFHSMRRGEFCYKPLKKGKYNRTKIAQELTNLANEGFELGR